VDGWMGIKAILRIAYNNQQKLSNYVFSWLRMHVFIFTHRYNIQKVTRHFNYFFYWITSLDKNQQVQNTNTIYIFDLLKYGKPISHFTIIKGVKTCVKIGNFSTLVYAMHCFAFVVVVVVKWFIVYSLWH
jgi:hypothetical protein